MSNTLIALIPWLKTLHLIAAFCWVGGQIALAALLLLRANSSALQAERALMRRLLNPALLVTLVAGVLQLGLLGKAYWQQADWLGWKLLLVLGLTALHGLLISRLNRQQRGETVPAFGGRLALVGSLMLAAFIIGLAVMKP